MTRELARRLTEVSVDNFLSLRDVTVALEPLNVLVGPNGAGKTNLMKVFQFLGEIARRELAPAVEQVGGYDQLFFRGKEPSGSTIKISLKGVVTKYATEKATDEYRLSFWRQRVRIGIGTAKQHSSMEMLRRIEEIKFKRFAGQGRRITLRGGKVSAVTTSKRAGTTQVSLPFDIEGEVTGLGTLRRFGESYGSTEWSSFAELVEGLRLFEVDVEKVRQPRSMDGDRLYADGSNVAPFLFRLSLEEPDVYEVIKDDLRFVLPSFEDFQFTRIGGAIDAIRLDIKENHLKDLTPLARASYGTIRAIALFAMLNDPAPPALTCLEEIDHGLHPHALDRIVERLRDASRHTQIIVATHSPALVNRLKTSELLIVEANPSDGSTNIVRPDIDLVEKLEQETDYQLGELWFSGLIGGIN